MTTQTEAQRLADDLARLANLEANELEDCMNKAATLLRRQDELLKQALEALDACVTDEGPEQHELTAAREALKNLRAALAQQDAQAVYQYQKSDGSWIDQTESSYQYNAQNGATNLRVLYAAPTPPAQQPLCWLDRKSVECLQGSEMTWMPAWNRPTSSDSVPVFLGPPAQRVMLTDEEIWNSDTIMAINAEAGLPMTTIAKLARAVIEAYERKNGIEVGRNVQEKQS